MAKRWDDRLLSDTVYTVSNWRPAFLEQAQKKLEPGERLQLFRYVDRFIQTVFRFR